MRTDKPILAATLLLAAGCAAPRTDVGAVPAGAGALPCATVFEALDRAVVEAGGTIIAQDEASSVVWGMPGAVATAGICSAVLPLGEIGGAIESFLRGPMLGGPIMAGVRR